MPARLDEGAVGDVKSENALGIFDLDRWEKDSTTYYVYVGTYVQHSTPIECTRTKITSVRYSE